MRPPSEKGTSRLEGTVRNNQPNSAQGTTDVRYHRPEDEPLGRPRTSRLPKPQEERAAQFMPFAALTGFEDYLARVEQEASGKKAPENIATETTAFAQRDGGGFLDNLG